MEQAFMNGSSPLRATFWNCLCRRVSAPSAALKLNPPFFFDEMGKKIKLKQSSSQTRAEQRVAGFFSRVAWVQEPKLLHTEREGAAGGRSSEERKRRGRRRRLRSREQQGPEVEPVRGEEVITLHSSAAVPWNISLNLQQSVWSSAKAKKISISSFF